MAILSLRQAFRIVLYSVLFITLFILSVSSVNAAAPEVIGSISNQTAHHDQTFDMSFETYSIFSDPDAYNLNVNITQTNDSALPAWLTLETIPISPGVIGTCSTEGSARGVAVAGNYAYVASDGSGLTIIDISTPSSPSLIGTCDTPGEARGVAIVDNYAYVADGDSGLTIIDISNPSNSSLVGSLDIAGYARGVAVVGNYAYVADADLTIIDISTPSSPSLVGTCDTPGEAYGIAVVSNYAYVVGSSGLQIINISNPVSPNLVGTYNTPNSAYGVVVVGNYAYVVAYAASQTGLRIIDISNPASPSLVGTYDTDGTEAYGVAVVNNHAYIVGWGTDFQIIDISNPVSPSLVVKCGGTSGSTKGVTAVDKYAYVADNSVFLGPPSLKIIEVLNEEVCLSGVPSMSDVGTLNLKAIASDGVDTVSTTFSIDVLDTALPEVSTVSKLGTEDAILVFNATDFEDYFTDIDGDSLTKIQITSLPSNGILKLSGVPVILDQEIVVGNLTSLTFEPDVDWSGHTGFDWKGHDGLYYSTTSAKVNIQIDAVNDAPTVVGSISNKTALYTQMFDTSIFTYDIFSDFDSDNLNVVVTQADDSSLPAWLTAEEKPISPSLVWSLAGCVSDVVVVGNYAYVATGEDEVLKIMDISTPSSPSLVGTCNTVGRINRVTVVGNYAYVGEGPRRLTIIDISNPSNPNLVGTCFTTGVVNDIAVVGNYAYVADGYAGLLIIDISTPSSPYIVGSLDEAPCEAYGVAVVGNYAYVSDSCAGLFVVDISTPSSPELVGTYDTPGSAYGIAVVGNYAYMADGYTGLIIIDISTPSSPSLIGSLDTANAHGVTVVGNYAYVADCSAGLQIIDISTPSSPELVGTYDTSDKCILKVKVVGNYAYATYNYEEGFKIIAINKGVRLSGVPSISDVGILNLKATASDGVDAVSTTFSIDVRTLPTVSAMSKSETEDAILTFNATDFTDHFVDIDGDSLTKIQITSLPMNGILKLSGVPVILDQEVVIGDLSNLTFEPNTNWNGITSFNWKGHDGTGYSATSASVNINIASVNDLPTISDVPKTGTENTVVTFSAADFTSKFSDVDGDRLTKIMITSLPMNSILKLSGVLVILNQEVVIEDLSNLTFEPNTDWNGNTSFGWKGYDGTGYSTISANVTINIVDDSSALNPATWDAIGGVAGVATVATVAGIVGVSTCAIMKNKGLGCFKGRDVASREQDVELEDQDDRNIGDANDIGDRTLPTPIPWIGGGGDSQMRPMIIPGEEPEVPGLPEELGEEVLYNQMLANPTNQTTDFNQGMEPSVPELPQVFSLEFSNDNQTETGKSDGSDDDGVHGA